MAKKNTRKKSSHADSKRVQRVVLGAAIVAALGAVAVMVLVLPSDNAATPSSGGFSVFEKKGADLGIAKVTSKQTVEKALGSSAKNVKDVDVSGVLSSNGNLGQTATYYFTTPDGTNGSIDVDVMEYKDQKNYDDSNVQTGTGSAGTVANREVRYIPAASIGKDRIYSLLVSNGLKSYKFALSQPSNSIKIKEYKAQDILKEIIKNSQL